MFLRVKTKLIAALGSTILSGSSWLIVGQVVSKFLVLLGSIVIVRIIGKQLYGELAILKSTINTFTSISSAAFGIAATKYIAEYSGIDMRKVSRIISLASIVVFVFAVTFAILIMIFSSYLSISLLDNDQLQKGLKICGLILLFSSMNGLQQGIWIGFEKFKIISLVNVVSGISSLVGQMVGAYYFGLSGALLGYGCLFIIQFIINQYLLQSLYNDKGVSLSLTGLRMEVSILWKFILPTMLSGIIVMPIVWTCNTFLVQQNNGYVEMANFDVALQWQALIIFIPTAVSKVILPFIAKERSQNKSYKGHMKLYIRLTFLITLIISIAIALFSKSILSFYGKDFLGSPSVLLTMCGAGVFMSLNSVIGQVITTEGKMWNGFLFNVIWAISLLTLSYFLIKYFQTAFGLALAYLISYMLLFIIQRLFYFKLALL